MRERQGSLDKSDVVTDFLTAPRKRLFFLSVRHSSKSGILSTGEYRATWCFSPSFWLCTRRDIERTEVVSRSRRLRHVFMCSRNRIRSTDPWMLRESEEQGIYGCSAVLFQWSGVTLGHLQSVLARDAQVVSELFLDSGLLQKRRHLRPRPGHDHEPRLHVIRSIAPRCMERREPKKKERIDT